MTHAVSGKEFREQMHRRYASEFHFHRVVAVLLEAAISRPRSMSNEVAFSLDMFMTQAYKSHYSVRLMAENGHSEDAALLTRRIMELAAQAAYVGDAPSEQERLKRAGAYLANLWRSAPPELKQHIPDVARNRWLDIDARHSANLPKRGWAPNFKEMFSAIGQPDTYEQDYRYLSTIAHGSPDESVLHYSMDTVMLRSGLHLPTLLTYSSKYYLALAHVWEDHFHLVDQEEYKAKVEPLLQQLDKS